MLLARSGILGRARRRAALAGGVAGLVVLGACTGPVDDPDDPAAAEEAAEEADEPLPDPDSTVTVTGFDDLAWDPEELAASAGVVEVVLTCEDRVNHNFVIDETGEEVVACRPGETRRGVVELDAGAYTFVCTVPGHEATMRGTLTVAE